MNAMTAAPGVQSGPANPKGGQAAPMRNSFVRAARQHREPFHDNSVQLVAATSRNVGPVDVAAYGYARSLVLLVEATGGAASGTNAVADEDAPWDILQDVQLTDTNGMPIVGPMDGYHLYLANRFGGYQWNADPALAPSFSTVATSGNFAFKVRVPLEITRRDGWGALPNMTASQPYKLSYTIGAPSSIYTTSPGTLPTVRVRAWLEAWTQPPAVDGFGIANETAPPMLGTTQYWTVSQHNVSAGEQTIQLPRTGNLIRNLIFVWRDDASPDARQTTTFPDPMRLHYDGRIELNVGRTLLRDDQVEDFGGLAADLETGVFVLPFTGDNTGHPGNELRNDYLPTTRATRLELLGNFGEAGVLSIITNDISPAVPQAAAAA